MKESEELEAAKAKHDKALEVNNLTIVMTSHRMIIVDQGLGSQSQREAKHSHIIVDDACECPLGALT